MSEDIKRPSAALINREWFEAASSILRREELGEAVLCACEYVLYGKIASSVGGSVGVVLAMIKPALDSDVAKYLERCARNAANARSRSERVAASGSEWQRVAANTTTTPTTTTTTTPISLECPSDSEERDRERFILAVYFAEHGSEAPIQELDAFWNYYESLGWKNNKGAPIVRKRAAAGMWRPQFATREVSGWRAEWYKALHWSKSFDMRLLSDVRGACIEGESLVLSIVGGEAFAKFLDETEGAVLRRFVASMGCKGLQYKSS